ncbi:MAG: RbsD/FucU domain-containing protein [Pseudomonadota bacterium]
MTNAPGERLRRERRSPGAEVVTAFEARLPAAAVSHKASKEMSEGAVAVVRTGKVVPYTNVVLVSGMPF